MYVWFDNKNKKWIVYSKDEDDLFVIIKWLKDNFDYGDYCTYTSKTDKDLINVWFDNTDCEVAFKLRWM